MFTIFIDPECYCHKNVSLQFIEEALGNSCRYSVGVLRSPHTLSVY